MSSSSDDEGISDSSDSSDEIIATQGNRMTPLQEKKQFRSAAPVSASQVDDLVKLFRSGTMQNLRATPVEDFSFSMLGTNQEDDVLVAQQARLSPVVNAQPSQADLYTEQVLNIIREQEKTLRESLEISKKGYEEAGGQQTTNAPNAVREVEGARLALCQFFTQQMSELQSHVIDLPTFFLRLADKMQLYSRFVKNYATAREWTQENQQIDTAASMHANFWVLYDGPLEHSEEWIRQLEFILSIFSGSKEDTDHLTLAYRKMSAIAQFVRTSTFESIKLLQVSRVRRRLDKLPQGLLVNAEKSSRKFVREGDMEVSFIPQNSGSATIWKAWLGISSKSDKPKVLLHVVLFTDMLLFASTTRNDLRRTYRFHITLDTLRPPDDGPLVRESGSAFYIHAEEAELQLRPLKNVLEWADALQIAVMDHRQKRGGSSDTSLGLPTASSGTSQSTGGESSSDSASLSFGTLRELIESLTDVACPDASFQTDSRTLLITYRLLFRGIELWAELERRFRMDSDNKKEVQRRVVWIIKEWMTSFWSDFEDGEELSQNKDRFITVEMEEFSVDHSSTEALQQWVTDHELEMFRNASPISVRTGPVMKDLRNLWEKAPPKIMPESLPPSAAFSLLDSVDPRETARQMCITDSAMFVSIQLSELLEQNWNKHPDRAPNVTLMIHHFNRLSKWFAWLLVREKDLKIRTMALKNMVDVGYHCLMEGNFNGGMEIVAALGSSPIRRLKKTFGALSSKRLTRLEEMRAVLSTALNFKLYRKTLKGRMNEKLPMVPYLGVYLQDLTFIDEGNAAWVDEQARKFSFSKCRRLAKVFSHVEDYRQVPYVLQPIPELQWYLMAVQCDLDESQLFKLSLEAEPREKSHTRRPSILN